MQISHYLLIFSDGHAKQALCCYGNQGIKPPTQDRIADEGTHVGHALTPNSSCTTARATALNGKYSLRNDLTHMNQHLGASQQASIDNLPTAEALADKDSGSVRIARMNSNQFFIEQQKLDITGQQANSIFTPNEESGKYRCLLWDVSIPTFLKEIDVNETPLAS